MAGDGMGDIEHRAPERIVQDRRCASCRNYQGRVCQHVLPEDREPVEYVRADLHRGAVCFTEAELAEVEWSLRQRLDAWDDPDRKAKAATERAHRKVLDRIGGR